MFCFALTRALFLGWQDNKEETRTCLARKTWERNGLRRPFVDGLALHYPPTPFFFRQLKKRFSLEVLTNERTAHKGRTRFSSQLFLYRCESKWRLREVLVADDS
jgi:hypothetical protein